MRPLVFDLDGTLIDSAPDIHRVANAVLALEGLAPISFAEARSFIGSGVSAFVARALAARGLPAEGDRHARMVAAFTERYEHAHELTTPYPGAAEALARLAAAGHPLGLCTNKPLGPTLAALRHFRLEGLFAAVVGGDSLPERKPHPAPLLETVARLGGGAAVFVGDSEVDAETARRAGVPFLLFTEGYRKAPAEALPQRAAFADWAALPDLVAAL
ncbi:MAG: phosphoglycolate phosphatase [Rhodobacteraceae bacterium]|nr:phosphoglycolate phosphatase [Paracoccaceae bacterium]